MGFVVCNECGILCDISFKFKPIGEIKNGIGEYRESKKRLYQDVHVIILNLNT